MSTTNKFQCILIGSESLTVQCGKILLNKGHIIARVVSNAPAVVGWAAEINIPCLPDAAALLEDPVGCDLLWSVANLRVLPGEVLALAKQAAINFHDGPLPRYAGINTPSWALINGEPAHGITWHIMTDQIDAGDILNQRCFDIEPGETSLTLNTKCYEAGIESFEELVEQLQTGSVKRTPQPNLADEHFGRYKRPEAASMIDWTKPAEQIAALVRALDFGSYHNPIGLPKTQLDQSILTVGSIEVLEDPAHGLPGSFVKDGNRFIVAAGDFAVAVSDLQELNGKPFPAPSDGQFLILDSAVARKLTETNTTICKHETFWTRRLAQPQPLQIPYSSVSTAAPNYETRELAIELADKDKNLAYHLAYFTRLCGTGNFDVEYSSNSLLELISGVEPWFADGVPLRLNISSEGTWNSVFDHIKTRVAATNKHTTYALDLIARHPAISKGSSLSVGLRITNDLQSETAIPGSELTIVMDQNGCCIWIFDRERLAPESITDMQAQLLELISSISAEPQIPLHRHSILPENERERLLGQWNDTASQYPHDRCMHELIEEQVRRTPDQVAVRCNNRSLSYRQLDERANQMAHHLRSLGVGPDGLVGIFVNRSVDMMVGLLGILKAGGAYVPLDPDYPRDRIAFMVDDTQMQVIVTEESLLDQVPESDAHLVAVDQFGKGESEHPKTTPEPVAQAENLAYLIYTSGSTGVPKGVQVEHRNASNFFAGMDSTIGTEAGVWLAVTSLSFDISVLELFWTLARGFEVIIFAEHAEKKAPPRRVSNQPLDFSLFYFSSNESEHGQDKYRLLLEGARFGDQNGFVAVWTPERHFHAFGGLYPNPSVTSAALATITNNIQLRSGSCVLPLHHPVRVTEEWSVVDNLSGGRVALAFAAGWQPDDFLLRPENFEDRKQNMMRDIEIVRSLWRGETIEFPGANGEPVPVSILPRPVQAELPFWLTVAGNPETFEMAGTSGANLLTHLLGQSIEELAEKITLYRKARAAAGHEGPGIVSLMLHTYLGTDLESVRSAVRRPLIEYLRSAANLIKEYAWAFPAFKRKEGMADIDLNSLPDEDMDALLEFAFERYFETSGLFGTPDSCIDMIEKIKKVGIDECACLIDFGVPTDLVLNSLPHLNDLRSTIQDGAKEATADHPLATLIRHFGVTHMQCTPSMASMLIQDDSVCDSLRSLQTLLIGGETFPPSLAAKVCDLVQVQVINMYGPTETTVWSSTYKLQGDESSIPIGKPIANTQIYVVDQYGQPTPTGVPGELLIGGDGVVRGYQGRPDLTAERFVKDQTQSTDGRVYRTGDLARWRSDGVLEFLGRMDNQVKLRGYRIELGEIEAALASHSSVQEAVVIVREDQPGDKRLVAYLVEHQEVPDSEVLRKHLRTRLPDYMVPAYYVTLGEFPLTPNAKIDRMELPLPEQTAILATQATFSPPENDIEEKIAEVWREVLLVPKVGTHDNFFDLGGHSLLAVQALRMLRESLSQPVSITDLFRFPTIRSLAEFLGKGSDNSTLERSTDRGQSRRAAMLNRQKKKRKRQATSRKI